MESAERNHAYLIFIFVLSVLALGVLAAQAILPLDQGTQNILDYADAMVCVLFFGDFLIVFCRSQNKRRYLLTWGWLDLASSIPTLDILRWGRAARIFRIFRVLRGIRSARMLAIVLVERRAQSTFLSVIFLAVMLVSVSAITVLYFETGSGANIKTAEDAIWWAITTITTVGYGDRYPVTSEGRAVAAILMAFGVGVFGTLSAYIATWFLAPSEVRWERELAAMQRELAEIKQLLIAKEKDAGNRLADDAK